jgi:4-hydroxy-tetrahydrodipicolinate synthase
LRDELRAPMTRASPELANQLAAMFDAMDIVGGAVSQP